MRRTETGVRMMIGVPPGGLGQQLSAMQAWLDREVGAGAYALRAGDGPAGTRALHLDLGNERLARAFVHRWVDARVEFRPA